MLSPQALLKGLIAKILPIKTTDGAESEGAVRLNEYREIFIPLSRHGWAKEGSYFATPNPTLGTGVAGAIAASFVNTTAAFVFQNTTDPAQPTSKHLDLDFIKIDYTVAPATATGFEYAVVLDSASRVPSAGFAALTPGQVGAIINATIAKVWAFTGAAFMTVPAPSSNARTVARGALPGLPVVGTEHMIRFGTDGSNAVGSVVDAPVSVPPGWFAVVYLWWPGNATTGPSAEYLLGHIER